MSDETYPGEEQMLYDTCKEMRRGHLYYDEKSDEILQLTNRAKVYFRPQLFWKLVIDVGGKKRRVRTVTEAKEIMNQCGYEYLGEL